MCEETFLTFAKKVKGRPSVYPISYIWLQFKVQSDNEIIREVAQEDEEKNDEGGRAI